MALQSSRPKLGQILFANKLINEAQLRKALAHAQQEEVRIGEALIELGFVTDVMVYRALAKQNGVQFIDLTKHLEQLLENKELLEMVDPKTVAEFNVIPVQKKGKVLTVASSELLDLIILDSLKFSLGCEVNYALTTPEALSAARKRMYAEGDDELTSMYDEMGDGVVARSDLEVDGEDLEDSNLVKLVNMVISEAIKGRASDIHVEPFEKRFRIRYRVDGQCAEVESPPKRLQAPILARIKIMSEMDIAEKRKPQDGRIKMQYQGRDIDFRVSALPARHGESIVLRILDKASALVELETLGFHPTDHARFKAIIKRPNGIFLVTGPTGSGKTTTLYSALQALNSPNVKIITAENPIEYNFTGINQCQVNHKIGLDFARIIRAMLRQAPNIILVGEIRDKETADIAIQAALTGHLCFSTLHTNDAPSAITRLIDMGVKPFLVASSIQAIMAQRLVRKICSECREPFTPNPTDLRMIGLSDRDIEGRTIYRPVGCPACGMKGYKGRMGIFELLEMSPPMRELAFKKSPTLKLRNEARLSGGMLTLQEDGVRKFLEGKTSIDEILNVTHRADLQQ